MQEWIQNFFIPKLDARFGIRLLAIIAGAVLFFGYVCVPCVINGKSMMPTYGPRGITFSWQPAFWFGRRPRRGDIVTVRLTGRRVMLLKRVVALGGDTVEFRHGRLYVNGERSEESWNTLGACDWELPVRTVDEGCVYVVGDNRTMPMEEHIFGQCPEARVAGKPLW